jgi:hypothetical protein
MALRARSPSPDCYLVCSWFCGVCYEAIDLESSECRASVPAVIGFRPSVCNCWVQEPLLGRGESHAELWLRYLCRRLAGRQALPDTRSVVVFHLGWGVGLPALGRHVLGCPLAMDAIGWRAIYRRDLSAGKGHARCRLFDRHRMGCAISGRL